jgi:hypothetical protein
MITTFSLLLVPSAFADCRQELTKLDQAAVSAQTGAATDPSGMPATKHQKEVLSGNQQGTSEETTGSTSGKVEAISPHQQEVTGGATGHNADQISQTMAEARKLADAGDEAGCMQKVTELNGLMKTD